MVCRNDGVVLVGRCLDDGAEWRTFANDDRVGADGGAPELSRVGAADDGLLDGGGALATTIGPGGGGGGTRGPRGAAAGSVRALHAATSLSSRDRSLLGEYERIGALVDTLGLPAAVGDAAKALLKRGRDAEAAGGAGAVAKRSAAYEAAAVLLACRHAGVARGLREIVAAVGRADVSLKSLNACLERLKAVAGGAPGVSLEALVARLAGALRLSQPVEMVAASAAGALREAAGAKRAETVAAAAVWLTSRLGGEARPLSEVAAAAGVGEATVRAVREEVSDAVVLGMYTKEYLAAATAGGRRIGEALMLTDTDSPG